MTVRAPRNAQVLLLKEFAEAQLRALKAEKKGKVRLLLEVNASRLARELGLDEESTRFSEYDSEAELFSAFHRAAGALAHS
jgi:hypothetical protein